MIGCLERPFRGVEHLTDLAVFPFFKIAKLEDNPLDIGQGGDGLLQQGLDLRTIEIGIGHQGVGNRQHIIDADILMLVAAKEVQALVDGDTRQPSADMGIAMKTGQTVPGLQKGVLEHIVGILMGEHDTSDLPVELFTILTHNLLKGTSLCLWILKQR